MLKTIHDKFSSFSKSYVFFALLPFCLVSILFLFKILTLKSLTFGDDAQMLEWFCKGKFAFPLLEIAKGRISSGRFYPLYYQNFNLVSLFSSDLTFNNLAERCFYVQAGMWLLTCLFFYLLMSNIARKDCPKNTIWRWFFIPLSLVTMLFTQSFSSYFLMLALAETLHCVLFPAFFFFYYLGYKNDNTLCFVLAFIFAFLALFCKENTFSIFLAIGSIGLLFGWKSFTNKHKVYLFSLIAGSIFYLVIYYFFVFRYTTDAYNNDRMWGVGIFTHMMRCFANYPAWALAFVLGFWRLVKLIFYRDRTHLFMDSILFGALFFFISYFILGLVDWWYWGSGMLLLFPVFFHWFLICDSKQWQVCLLAFFVLCCISNVRSVRDRIGEINDAQQEDMQFIATVNKLKNKNNIFFYACDEGPQQIFDQCLYHYFSTFMKKLSPETKWDNKIFLIKEKPSDIYPNDLFVIRQNFRFPNEFQKELSAQGFEKICVCPYYQLYASTSETIVPLKSFRPDSAECTFCGFSSYEPMMKGRWISEKQSSVEFTLDLIDGQSAGIVIKGFPFLFEQFNKFC